MEQSDIETQSDRLRLSKNSYEGVMAKTPRSNITSILSLSDIKKNLLANKNGLSEMSVYQNILFVVYLK